MITRREAERLCKSFLGDNTPPRLPEDFSFRVHHECAWGCRGLFLPARYNSSRAKCIKCALCGLFFSPNKFIFHSHRTGPGARYVQPDAANFNSWRRHMRLSGSPPEEVVHAWEDVKAMFNGGTRKRLLASAHGGSSSSSSGLGGGQGLQVQQQGAAQGPPSRQAALDAEPAKAPPSPVKAHPTSPSGPSPAKMSKSSGGNGSSGSGGPADRPSAVGTKPGRLRHGHGGQARGHGHGRAGGGSPSPAMQGPPGPPPSAASLAASAHNAALAFAGGGMDSPPGTPLGGLGAGSPFQLGAGPVASVLPLHAHAAPVAGVGRGLPLDWGPWGRASPLPLPPLGSPLPPSMAPPPLGPAPHHVLPPYAAALPWLAPKRSLLAFSSDGEFRKYCSCVVKMFPCIPRHFNENPC